MTDARAWTSILLPALMAAGLVVASGPAAAVYQMTPLRLMPSSSTADVGDRLVFEVAPENESATQAWAGRAVTLRYGYDADERPAGSEDPDEPTGSSSWVQRDGPQVPLDDAAGATFEWTVPEEAADHNVFLSLVDDAGEPVATAHVQVGDAPPMMFAAGGGPADSGPQEPVQESAPGAGADETGARVPAPGMLAVAGVAVAAAAALVALRLRR